MVFIFSSGEEIGVFNAVRKFLFGCVFLSTKKQKLRGMEGEDFIEEKKKRLFYKKSKGFAQKF